MADLTCSLDGANAWRTRRVSARFWTRCFVPDLSVLVSIISAFICLFLFDGTRQLFRDSDTGWHIRTGEAILNTGHLPRTDPYSLTKNGAPWFAWEWAADVLMGAAHRTGGLAGVAGLYAFVIGLCTWLWFRLHWIAGGNFLLAAAMSTLLVSTQSIHWLARPHVFSWAFLIAAVWYAERGPGKLSVVAVVSVLWANIHASFFFGPVILVIYAVSCFSRPLIWTMDRRAEWGAARWYAAAAAVSALATLVNPYGWNLHRHVYRYLTDADLIAHIGEYQSFNFHADGAAQILITVAIAAFGGVLALGQRKLAWFLLSALWIGLALRSARALPVAALLLLPLANGAISRALASARDLRPPLDKWLRGALTYCSNLRQLDRSAGGVGAVAVAILCFAWVLMSPPVSARAGFPPEQFPVAAANVVEKLPDEARLLAPDMYGGYLIYRFSGARKVFFDGRSDFYGSEYMKNYLRLIEVRPGWRELLDSAGFTHALLPNRYSLIPALEQLGWKKLYSDRTATLLEKN